MQCWVSAILLVLCSSKVLFGNGHPEVTPELCQIEVEKEIKDGIPPGEQCKQYSENKNGPCLNGGNLLCEGNILVTEASCNCSESFSGKFCEIKTVQGDGYDVSKRKSSKSDA
uniref:Uncharacterized protein n=1 Tax=Magallana gigas TaxID=29159 RepID=K1QKH7_MAGGI